VRESCAKGRAGKILEFPDLERLVPELPAADLYYAIQEIGLRDAHALLSMASPEQIRTFLDLDVWSRDRVATERLMAWIDLLWPMRPYEARRKLDKLDPELLAFHVAKGARVLDLTLEEVPEDPVEGPWRTPDTFYALVPYGPERVMEYRRVCRFLDRLYMLDHAAARRTVMAARWEPIAELEEYSYRWRTGRIQDLGFADYYEALEVYAYLKPSSVRPDEGLPDPPPQTETDRAGAGLAGGALIQTETAGEKDFLAACLELVEDPAEMARISHAAAGVANRMMSADLVTEPDYQTLARYMKRTRRYLGIGLEYLSRGDPTKGPEILRNVTLMRIHRAGLSLTIDVKRLVEKLRRAGRISLAPHGTTLLDPPWDELVAALTERRPELIRAFDVPPAEGRRPMADLTDIQHAALLVEDLSMQWPLCFDALGFPLELLTGEALTGTDPSDPARLTLGDIFRTAFANCLLGRGLEPTPLTEDELVEASGKLAELNDRGISLVKAGARAVEEALQQKGKPGPRRLERVIGAWLTPLADPEAEYDLSALTITVKEE
jgi:hypothetical protein